MYSTDKKQLMFIKVNRKKRNKISKTQAIELYLDNN